MQVDELVALHFFLVDVDADGLVKNRQRPPHSIALVCEFAWAMTWEAIIEF